MRVYYGIVCTRVSSWDFVEPAYLGFKRKDTIGQSGYFFPHHQNYLTTDPRNCFIYQHRTRNHYFIAVSNYKLRVRF